jgi:ABC-type polysaccharide/polyol phosphate transport system ATPase subunit
MARIELQNAGVDFRIRKTAQVTLKEYLLRGMFFRNAADKLTVQALRGIDFTATDGDRIGIIGHNGAGKSTLLKLIAGIYPPTTGQRLVTGRISSLFDITLGFEEEANGWDNIRYRSYLQGESPKTVKEKMFEIAAFSELGEFLNVPLRAYSAGMRIRLAFAIATAANPEVLLIDEILGVGDLAFQLKARERMQQMMRAARLLVLVSHDLEALPAMCDRTIWMNKGQIVMSGRTEEVIAAYTENATPRAPVNVGGYCEAA